MFLAAQVNGSPDLLRRRGRQVVRPLAQALWLPAHEELGPLTLLRRASSSSSSSSSSSPLKSPLPLRLHSSGALRPAPTEIKALGGTLDRTPTPPLPDQAAVLEEVSAPQTASDCRIHLERSRTGSSLSQEASPAVTSLVLLGESVDVVSGTFASRRMRKSSNVDGSWNRRAVSALPARAKRPMQQL